MDDEASNASDVSFDSKMTDTTWIGELHYVLKMSKYFFPITDTLF